MARVNVRDESIAFDSPILVEGLPGVGLVGKIATDHLVEKFDMSYYASIDCEGLPQVAIYREDARAVESPVRLYADEERNLLALRSDVPVSPSAADEFATCLTGWLHDHDVTPLYLSGLPTEKQPGRVPSLYAVATRKAGGLLDDHDVDLPPENGVVSGPTGALLNRADETGLDAVGLVVESDKKFPDPEAARVLIQQGIAPLADVEVDVDDLVDRAEQIRDQKEKLAKRMQETGTDEASQAQPLKGFH
jgi:uncharacterized protein